MKKLSQTRVLFVFLQVSFKIVHLASQTAVRAEMQADGVLAGVPTGTRVSALLDLSLLTLHEECSEYLEVSWRAHLLFAFMARRVRKPPSGRQIRVRDGPKTSLPAKFESYDPPSPFCSCPGNACSNAAGLCSGMSRTEARVGPGTIDAASSLLLLPPLPPPAHPRSRGTAMVA